MRRIRLFTAFAPPVRAMDAIRPAWSLLREQLTGIRWEPEEKLHSTLKFLGECSEELIPEIVDALTVLCAEYRGEIPLRFGNFDVLPSRTRPGVVVISIEDPTGHLTRIHERIEAAMEQIGFPRETRSFRPHLTIGRIRERNRPGILLEKTETVTFQSDLVPISEIMLVASTLTPGGSIYRTIGRFRFGKEPPSRHSNPA
ncbi:MAG: RNA 2',3'-cyclic phosphodiesterase [Ignavibacteria bacterium]|nr:RNA 2',3'-cyclic phosphodiesterase [Ignavibacteria bacterium]